MAGPFAGDFQYVDSYESINQSWCNSTEYLGPSTGSCASLPITKSFSPSPVEIAPTSHKQVKKRSILFLIWMCSSFTAVSTISPSYLFLLPVCILFFVQINANWTFFSVPLAPGICGQKSAGSSINPISVIYHTKELLLMWKSHYCSTADVSSAGACSHKDLLCTCLICLPKLQLHLAGQFKL